MVTFLGKADYIRSWNEEFVASLKAPCRNSRRSSEENVAKIFRRGQHNWWL